MMFDNIENITQRALKALEAAHTAAQRAQHPQIEPAHLLVGLAQTQGSLAATVLYELGIAADSLFDAAKQFVPVPPPTAPVQTLELSPAFQQTLSLAQGEAKRQGDDFLATEHLLLALLQQQSPTVIKMLEKHQVRVENVRYSIQHLLAEADASQPLRPAQLDAAIAARQATQNIKTAPGLLMRLLQPLIKMWQALTGTSSKK
jgi:ATP-dependent Clp protease ATP-binding subunit ClpC